MQHNNPPKHSTKEMPLFHEVYKLYKLLDAYHSNIPKKSRYTLWQQCQNNTLELLELVISIKYASKEKLRDLLLQISHKVDVLKTLIRLAEETSILNRKQMIEVQAHLQAIGKMTGGWMKSSPPSRS